MCIHGKKPILQKYLTLGHGRGDMDSPHTDERIELARHRMAAPGPDKGPHTKPSWPQTQGIGGIRQWGDTLRTSPPLTKAAQPS